MLAKMRNMGEACTAANRFLVHEAVAEEFTARLAARMAALRVGRGTEPGVQVGPLIDETLAGQDRRPGRRTRWTRGRRRSPAAGRRRAGLVLPTDRAADVAAGRRALEEEIFGPVAPVTTFATADEALALANDTEYGLVAYAFTNDLYAGAAPGRGAGHRHGRHQPGRGLESRRTVRRGEALRASVGRAAARASRSTWRRGTSASRPDRCAATSSSPAAPTRCGAGSTSRTRATAPSPWW